MRGETISAQSIFLHHLISIHSPHARGDVVSRALQLVDIIISIHSPHARGDARTGGYLGIPYEFQSTPLMRGETQSM